MQSKTLQAFPRAVRLADKEQRRRSILVAARRVLLTQPDRFASVEQVAAAAGLAKGTIYLYFDSKEELVLELYRDQLTEFIDAMVARLQQPEPMTFDDLYAIVRHYIVDSGTYLPLATLCFAMQEKSVPVEPMLALKLDAAAQLDRAAAALTVHFPQLDAQHASDLLLQGYGLIIGLWHLLHPMPSVIDPARHPELARIRPDFAVALEDALRALWSGHLAVRGPAAPAPLECPPR